MHSLNTNIQEYTAPETPSGGVVVLEAVVVGVVLAVGVVVAVIVAAVLAAVVTDRPVLISPPFLGFVPTNARLQLVGPLLQPGSGL